MEKENRITNNSDYKSVYSKGKSFSDYNLVLFVKRRTDENTRFGVTTAKKIKKAVERNRYRRRMKEIIRKNLHDVKPGYDLVLMCRLNGKDSDFSALEKSYLRLLKKSNLWKKELY
ncbi:MAG: ribonuclease P protein component [Tissierellales bacterium]|nr:ribonuclease P protein component [Tissierellales bacterium]MBN2827206.1 ribonuclease P protein component [Tissierellales bacterium]